MAVIGANTLQGTEMSGRDMRKYNGLWKLDHNDQYHSKFTFKSRRYNDASQTMNITLRQPISQLETLNRTRYGNKLIFRDSISRGVSPGSTGRTHNSAAPIP